MTSEDLDPCGEIDFGDPLHLTLTDDEQSALVMFADCWDDPGVVEERRAELVEWSEASDS